MPGSRNSAGMCGWANVADEVGGLLRLRVVGGDQNWLKNEVICVNLTKINNYFMNYKFIKSLFFLYSRPQLYKPTYHTSI